MDYRTTFLETSDIQLRILSYLSNQDIYNYTSTCQSLVYKNYTTLYCKKFLHLWKSNLLIENIQQNLLAIDPGQKISAWEKIKSLQANILKVSNHTELNSSIAEQARQIQILLNSVFFRHERDIKKEILTLSEEITSNFTLNAPLKQNHKSISDQIEGIHYLKNQILNSEMMDSTDEIDEKVEKILQILPLDNVIEILKSFKEARLFSNFIIPLGHLLDQANPEEKIYILDCIVVLLDRFPDNTMLKIFLKDSVCHLLRKYELAIAAKYFKRAPPDLPSLLWIIRDLYLNDHYLVFNELLAFYHQFEIPNFRRVELALRSFNSQEDLAFVCQNIGTLSDFLTEEVKLFDFYSNDFRIERVFFELISLALVKFDKYDQLPTFILNNCIRDRATLAHLLVYLHKKLSLDDFNLFLKKVKTQCYAEHDHFYFLHFLQELGFPY